MYGSVPGVFKNLRAASLAADSYQLEHNVRYFVMKKKVNICTTYYKPISINDVKLAFKDGFKSLEYKYNCSDCHHACKTSTVCGGFVLGG